MKERRKEIKWQTSEPQPLTSSTMSPRKLTARRGSVTASDPWGVHSELNLNPNRSSSSTLTIVRLLSSQSPEAPAPPIQRRYSGHRRKGSHSSNSSTSDAAPRLSFAFSSFGSSQGVGGPAGRPTSPTSPHRPSSPGQRQSSFIKPHLTPDQLLELARQSTAPFPSNHDSATRPHSLQNSFTAPVIAPATFTPLPPSVYLPFIDRPSEVASLISSPPTAKLFSLLAQTFPPSVTNCVRDFSTDPASWSFDQLTAWLTKVDREIAPDALWTLKARRCILSHSELMWERVKGALGVPPELDVDFVSPDDVDSESDGSGVGFAGKAGTGSVTWYDWDAVENSPLAEQPSPHLSSTSLDAHDEHLNPTPGLTIAPLLVSHPSLNQPSGSSSSLPPLSLPSALAQDVGLQEISEDAEEDEEVSMSVNNTSLEPKQEYPQPQIRGLRISTSPFVESLTHTPTARTLIPTPSDIASVRYPDTPSSALSSRSGSFSSLASFAGRRSASFSSRGGFSPGGSIHRSVAGSPLFPASFARLRGK
jgi:hypothetical protein